MIGAFHIQTSVGLGGCRDGHWVGSRNIETRLLNLFSMTHQVPRMSRDPFNEQKEFSTAFGVSG